ncbi:MAG: di-trans,poly-cis-decaprenylcistransferase [Chloroflexi bacterium]|nr:di-trans,poly-cis-decaprenylcistransferase [Chloroflexota bacterium]
MDTLQHIAIIPDGNRRWAKEHNLPISMGHKKGADALRDVLKAFYELEISNLSFWGASLANLTKRSRREVYSLETLYEDNFWRLVEDPTIHEHQVRVRVLGEWETVLGAGAKQAIKSAIQATEKYHRFSLNILIAYDGTLEMIAAIEKIIQKASGNKKIKVTPEIIKENLYTHDIPPVDLLIRTGGEPHLSAGFMMWEIAEAQFYFSDKYWPEFTGDDLRKAIMEFNERKRRFGK